jgi:hypothetical protein
MFKQERGAFEIFCKREVFKVSIRSKKSSFLIIFLHRYKEDGDFTFLINKLIMD